MRGAEWLWVPVHYPLRSDPFELVRRRKQNPVIQNSLNWDERLHWKIAAIQLPTCPPLDTAFHLVTCVTQQHPASNYLRALVVFAFDRQALGCRSLARLGMYPTLGRYISQLALRRLLEIYGLLLCSRPTGRQTSYEIFNMFRCCATHTQKKNNIHASKAELWQLLLWLKYIVALLSWEHRTKR